MTSTCFPHRYRIFIWHQWFFPQISYKTSMAFHRDMVFLYDINGFAHRYRHFIWHQWFVPHISYKTLMAFPIDIVFVYDIDGFSHRYRIRYDINCFARRYRIFYDINGFTNRYLLRHQWFCPQISYFYMTSTCFPHRYRILIWHQSFFPLISF